MLHPGMKGSDLTITVEDERTYLTYILHPSLPVNQPQLPTSAERGQWDALRRLVVADIRKLVGAALQDVLASRISVRVGARLVPNEHRAGVIVLMSWTSRPSSASASASPISRAVTVASREAAGAGGAIGGRAGLLARAKLGVFGQACDEDQTEERDDRHFFHGVAFLPYLGSEHDVRLRISSKFVGQASLC